MTDKWYRFQITVTVVAETETDAFRMMHPALSTLRELHPVRKEPDVELLQEDDPFYGHQVSP